MQLYADDDVDVEPVVLNGSVVPHGSQWFSMVSSDFIVVPSGFEWQSVIPVVLNGF